LRSHINKQGSSIPAIWNLLIRYTTPIILVYLLYLTFVGDLAKNYGDYPTDQLILYGGGWLLICLLAALVLAFSRWEAKKLKRRHLPEEDELLV
ncbi:MAG: sodium-dependent transporter, partial [Desulfobulbaceae bacterium]|nr:sodium-dependent transporter [Desulfobulbaceae bacterium]